MQKAFYILFFLFITNGIFAQVGLRMEKVSTFYKNKLERNEKREDVKIFFNNKNQDTAPTDLKKYFLSDNPNLNSSNIFSIKNPQHELAFFCRIENQLESSSNLPLRFRLGEVQAVDQKEGKWQQFQK